MPAICPASDLIASVPTGGPASRCRVAQETIPARSNPRSYFGWCTGDYCACTTWRDEKEKIWATGEGFDLKEEEGDSIN